MSYEKLMNYPCKNVWIENHDNNRKKDFVDFNDFIFCLNQTFPFTCKKWKCKFFHKWKYFFLLLIKIAKLPFDTKYFFRFNFVLNIKKKILSIKVKREVKGWKKRVQ